jgi:hypothetical protein
MNRRFKLFLLIPLLADCAHTALPPTRGFSGRQ